jgi:hypothetical protein
MATKTETKVTEEVKEEVVDPRAKMTPEQFMNEKVSLFLLYDGEKYVDDVVVSINGKTWQIQRGVNVEVPRFVHDLIMTSERQKRVATMTSQSAEKKFAALANQNIL